MSQESPNETSSPWMAICLGIGLCAILAAVLVLGKPDPSPGPDTKFCQMNLKQMGLCIHHYFDNQSLSTLPILKNFEVSTTNDGGFGFDAHMLSCPAERHDLSMCYVWNPKLSGGKWADWNKPNSPLIWDASPHRVNGKINVLFGDGHVEEMTPERLRELTR
jgi:prepilin-type processing-associated H-X9-DG protein